MHLVYVDDSYEKPTQTYAAIAVPIEQWQKSFTILREWRRDLKRSDGILVTKEFHATDFVAGRGRLGPKVVTKYRRSRIFQEAFWVLAALPKVKVFGVCRTTKPEWAFERLLTRIHVTMQTWDSHAVMICDEGKEAEFTRLIRKMGVYNPVPVYVAPGVLQTQNLKIDRIIEDPIFKSSERSYFVQMADFAAYGLLRREQPHPARDAYGIGSCYDALKNVAAKEASPNDPMGVIR